MTKLTQKEIRAMIRNGAAEDCTNAPLETAYALNHLNKVAYSAGKYGINGGVAHDPKTGKLYAIVGRCTDLFMGF